MPVHLTPDQTRVLVEMANGLGVTVNTVTQAAWGLVLARYLGRDDVVFGSTVSGRPHDLDGVESMVGLFINTVPVRVRLRDEESVAAYLGRLQGEQAELLEHHYLPLTDIQRTAGTGELFDTFSVFESYPIDEEGIAAQARGVGELAVTGINSEADTQFAMRLRIHLRDTLQVAFGYRTDVLTAETAATLADRFRRVLLGFLAAPQSPVIRVSSMEPGEYERIVREWNHTDSAVDETATLASLFAAQVARTPDAVAIVDGDRELTYADFDACANRLARHLISVGVGPDSTGRSRHRPKCRADHRPARHHQGGWRLRADRSGAAE